MNTYVWGSKVRLRTVEPFRNLAGEPVAPATVTVSVEDPSGDLTTPSVTTDTTRGTGHYYTEVTCSEEGEWSYHFQGSSDACGADRQRFKVTAKHF